MQLRNVDLNPRGRRFTEEEKVQALSIFKKSPAVYTHMANLFTVPSKTVLRNYLSEISLDTGINMSIVKHLTDLTKNLTLKDKQLSAWWDEAHVHPHVAYDFKKDKIIGFEDFGTHRTSKFADHVLVFMIRRLSDGTKIPYSYYYCQSHKIWTAHRMHPRKRNCHSFHRFRISSHYMWSRVFKYESPEGIETGVPKRVQKERCESWWVNKTNYQFFRTIFPQIRLY